GGTYFYHSHTGLQLDRGLHAPLIIRDPQDAEDQDVEWTIVLDDWVDGIQGTPDDELDKLTGMGSGDHNEGMGMGGHGQMMHGAPDRVLGRDVGDVMYPHYLINGRIPRAHRTLRLARAIRPACGLSTPAVTPSSRWPSVVTA